MSKRIVNSYNNKTVQAEIPFQVETSQKGMEFVGVVSELQKGINPWVELYNPRDSGVDIYISKIRVANFTAYPVFSKMYYSYDSGRGTSHLHGIPHNTNHTYHSEGILKYYSGDEVVRDRGHLISERVSPAYNTDLRLPDGASILAPGSCWKIFLTSRVGCKTPHVSVGLIWIEMPVKC